jgi:hypothetical protein
MKKKRRKRMRMNSRKRVVRSIVKIWRRDQIIIEIK